MATKMGPWPPHGSYNAALCSYRLVGHGEWKPILQPKIGQDGALMAQTDSRRAKAGSSWAHLGHLLDTVFALIV